MNENMTSEEMLKSLYEVQMKLFYDECDLLFAPMEDMMKADLFFEEDFEAA